MRFALGLFIRLCKEAQARCWLTHVGTKENLISGMASRTDLRSLEESTQEAGWEPRWLDITATMNQWERQLIQWSARHAKIDDVDDIDKEVEVEMREIEDLELQS